MKAVGYVRTSINEQDPGPQIEEIRKKGVPEDSIFVDRGVSGITAAKDRKEFSKMLECIEKNDIEFIYTFEVSRLGRTFYETLMLIKELEERGIKVISLSPSESFLAHIDNSMRELIISIFSWVAERERENLRERTKAGIEQARRKGKRIGARPAGINWKKFKRYKNLGMNVAQIARLLKINYNTLYGRVKRREEEIGRSWKEW